MYSCPWPYLLRVFDPTRDSFSRPPDYRNHGPEIDALIGSENTYPPKAEDE